MEQTLAHCVQYSLQNFLYENATFMAERLYAQEKSDLAKYLLASCYFKAGQFYKVCALLKGSLYERNRYLLAMACYRMGKHREAELALTDHFPSYTGHATPSAATAVSPLASGATASHSASASHSTSTSTAASPFQATPSTGPTLLSDDDALLDRVPNGAAGLFLLGQICKKQDQPARAKQCFQKCLALNPFLWSAFESLCELGSDIEAEEIFGVDAPSSAVQSPLDIEMSESEQVMENAAKITRDQAKKQPVTLQVPEANEPKAPRLVKTRSCVTQTTTPAIALRLFRQTPSKDRERERSRRASEERKSGIALAQQQHATTVEDSLPTLQDTPGNFFLSTVNLRRSPFQGRYGKSGDYDPDGFTPSQKSLAQPSQHQARQKAMHARREKAQRHKRTLDGAEAPKFNISRPGQLFHDDDVSSPQVVRSASNVSTTTASTTAPTSTANASLSQRNPPVSPYPTKFFQTENMALSLNQFLAHKKGSGSVQATPQSAMKQPVLEHASPFVSVHTPVSPELDEVRSTSAPRRSPNRDANGEPLSKENAATTTEEPASQPTGADSTIEVENEGVEASPSSSATSNRLPRELLEEAFGEEAEEDTMTCGEVSETSESQSLDESEASQLIEGATQVLSLLRVIGKAYTHMCRYDSLDAVEEFHKLPKDQFETGYVLCKVGKCYFEVVQYHKMFELARTVEPYRTEDMEIYSTILWQLNEPVPLSYLAQQLVELDKQSPATWCAVGNCFSLQKDHDSALKFFKRAIQVQPDFTYAYTLCGHEQVAGDNWDKALAFYRNAIRIDARHYNAWYGLGMIYFRQEKYSIAEYHFNKALEINCKNSVLYCYLGMVLRVCRRYEEAEIMLSHALKIDPSNALARYKKAVVLVNLGKLQPALSELFLLQESSPKEAPTCYLIGRVYKRMGRLDKASYFFTLAMDFDTKSSWTRSIKQAIAKLGTPDVEGGDVEATDKDTEDLEDLK